VAQAVECLPSKCEALSSKPSTTKEEKRKESAVGGMTNLICCEMCRAFEWKEQFPRHLGSVFMPTLPD
jgi:hypothetical protein